MKNELLQSALVDVRDTGSVRLDYRKLAWMLGRKNFGSSAWEILQKEWREIEPHRTLLVLRHDSFYTLLVGMPVSVERLAARPSPPSPPLPSDP